jgi:hypothetical protein
MRDYLGFPLLGWLSQHTKIRSHDNPDNIYADCPFCHGESKLAASKLHNIFRCYKCYEGGYCRSTWKGTCNLPKMIMLLEHCSYQAALAKIDKLSGKQILTKIETTVRPQKPVIVWPEESLWLKDCSMENPGSKMLRRRGVEHLISDAKYCVTGRYEQRVLLPAHYFGTLKGFEAKSTHPDQKPKTLYPEWFRTGESIYTTKRWDWSKDFVVITESILDAETLGCNAIGLYGSFLKISQFELILEMRRKGISTLVWMLDQDALKKSLRAIIQHSNIFFQNFVALLPFQEDPNSVGRDMCWELVSKAIGLRSDDDIIQILLNHIDRAGGKSYHMT